MFFLSRISVTIMRRKSQPLLTKRSPWMKKWNSSKTSPVPILLYNPHPNTLPPDRTKRTPRGNRHGLGLKSFSTFQYIHISVSARFLRSQDPVAGRQDPKKGKKVHFNRPEIPKEFSNKILHLVSLINVLHTYRLVLKTISKPQAPVVACHDWHNGRKPFINQ